MADDQGYRKSTPSITIIGLFRVRWLESGKERTNYFENEDAATIFSIAIQEYEEHDKEEGIDFGEKLIALECWNETESQYKAW